MPKRKLNLEPIEPKCDECVESQVIIDDKEGRNVCTSCGLVIGNRIISDESEWRTFADSTTGQDMNRVGGPTHVLLENEVASTQIANTKNSNLSRAQIRVSSGKTQQLLKHYGHIDETIQKLNLSASVKLIAESVFKQVFDLNEVKGRSKDVVIVACVYVACKLDGIPRSIKEMCAACGVKRRDVGRSYISLQKLQQSGRLVLRRSGAADREKVGSGLFVDRFCSMLKLPREFMDEAKSVCKRIEDLSLVQGRAPSSIAAVSIWLVVNTAADETAKKIISLADLSEISHLTRSSIKNLYRRYLSRARELISEAYAGDETIRGLEY